MLESKKYKVLKPISVDGERITSGTIELSGTKGIRLVARGVLAEIKEAKGEKKTKELKQPKETK